MAWGTFMGSNNTAARTAGAAFSNSHLRRPISPCSGPLPTAAMGPNPKRDRQWAVTAMSMAPVVGTTTPTMGRFSTLIHSFTGAPDGANPSGTLLEVSPGLLYGTTFAGGSGNQGTIFLAAPNGDYQIIHNFDNTDGSGPNGGLVLAGDGNYYGTTAWGGTNGGDGTIYRLNADQTVTSLFSFDGTNGVNPSDDLVVGQDGKLYGRTESGGANGDGTIFSITTNGDFESLFSFGGTNGIRPHAALFAGNDG